MPKPAVGYDVGSLHGAAFDGGGIAAQHGNGSKGDPKAPSPNTPGNPGGGHPVTHIEELRGQPHNQRPGPHGTIVPLPDSQLTEYSSTYGSDSGRGSESNPINLGEGTVSSDNRVKTNLTLQRGQDPTSAGKNKAYSSMVLNPSTGADNGPGIPKSAQGGVGSSDYRSTMSRHTAQVAEGKPVDSYQGSITDGQTGATAQVQYDADTGEAMGNTTSNLAAAQSQRTNSIATAKNSLPATDQQKMQQGQTGPKAPDTAIPGKGNR